MKNIKNSLAQSKKYEQYIFKVAPFRKPVLKSGNGSFVEDLDGNKYLDLMSGQFCLGFGHLYPEFNEVVIKQLKKIIHTNTLSLTEEVFKAAKALSATTNGQLKKTLFLSTGAEAVEAALRYAKFFTQKEGIVGIEDGYHGLTLATQSISSKGLYAKPRVPLTFCIPTPDWINRPKNTTVDEFIENCLKISESQLQPFLGKIAAFIVEPIISVGGMIFPPIKYFQGIDQLVKKHNSLLIFDECQTGLGRTGKWFAYQYFDIVPDILVVSKISGLGLPISAILLKDEIAKKVEGKYIHFSSHQNDPLSGAIIEFVIEHINKKNMLEKINKNGAYFLNKLTILSKFQPWIKNPRGLGLMIAFDLPYKEYNEKINPGFDLINMLENEGIIIQAIKRGKTFRILPNFLISKKEIDLFINKLNICIKKLSKKFSLDKKQVTKNG